MCDWTRESHQFENQNYPKPVDSETFPASHVPPTVVDKNTGAQKQTSQAWSLKCFGGVIQVEMVKIAKDSLGFE